MLSNLPPGVTDADINAQDDGFSQWRDGLSDEEVEDILHDHYLEVLDNDRQEEQEHRDDVARGC
jgi:hypothetical protein